jgi:hypothetical protein
MICECECEKCLGCMVCEHCVSLGRAKPEDFAVHCTPCKEKMFMQKEAIQRPLIVQQMLDDLVAARRRSFRVVK